MSLVPETPELLDFARTAEEVDEARATASVTLRQAINIHFVCPATLAEFPDEELKAQVSKHGVALAAWWLSSRDSGRSKKVVADADRADEWLAEVKAGEVDLSPLPRRTAGGGRAPLLAMVGTTRPKLDPRIFNPRRGLQR
jgi:hypothetical protein